MATPTPEEIAAGVPAGANIVDRMPGQNGTGTIVLDDRGGVYTLGGAQFYGSYFSEDMAVHRNDPNRTFTGIEGLEGGGYRIMSSTPGELGYTFGPTTAPAPAAAAPAAAAPAVVAPGDTEEGKSAKGLIDKLAADFGLDPAFVDRMWTNWLNNQDINRVYADMVSDPAYKARFPGMDALRTQGRAISEAEYIGLEQQYAGLFQYYGLPKGFYDDPADFGRLIGGINSPKEVEDRIVTAAQAATGAPEEVRSELRRLYGLSDGDLTAYFLDPDRGMDVITKQFTAAQIGGASVRSGFGQLSTVEAEGLGVGGAGLSGEQAAQRFDQITDLNPLFAETAEETTDLGRETQLGFVAGTGSAEDTIRRRQGARAARFEGGGGAAGVGQKGSGLGSA